MMVRLLRSCHHFQGEERRKNEPSGIDAPSRLRCTRERTIQSSGYGHMGYPLEVDRGNQFTSALRAKCSDKTHITWIGCRPTKAACRCYSYQLMKVETSLRIQNAFSLLSFGAFAMAHMFLVWYVVDISFSSRRYAGIKDMTHTFLCEKEKKRT